MSVAIKMFMAFAALSSTAFAASAPEVSCGSAAVRFGGPGNLCKGNGVYSGSGNDACDGSLRNCQSVCCTPALTCGDWAVRNGGTYI